MISFELPVTFVSICELSRRNVAGSREQVEALVSATIGLNHATHDELFGRRDLRQVG